ncbi:unnamed protein product [Discosporangium mesarthrocarpum]
MRNYAFKIQGVVLPNGIIVDLRGPVVKRCHDSYIIRSSLNARLREEEVGNPVQYHSFCDTAYAVLSYVKGRFKNSGWTQRGPNCGKQKHEPVEHASGEVCNLRGFFDHKMKSKPRQNMFVIWRLYRQCNPVP